jgi:NADH dehydrogenase
MALAKVVIIGGGFGGLQAARGLGRAPVEVVLVDRRNFHLFQPLLYQVATGGLSPGDICAPLRAVLRRQKNTRVLLAEARDVDVSRRILTLADGEISYDFLVVATGSRHHYFGRTEWERFAPGLKTVEDATEMRRRILLAFEEAERESDPDRRRAWLTFVVVGAGPTGVELAGALGELANQTLREDFRSIRPQEARILLVEHADRVLPGYPPDLSEKAERALIRHHVRSLTGVRVVEIDEEGVVIEHRSGGCQRIPARTVLWAAGVQASDMGRVLAERAGADRDRAGRVIVEPDLSLPGHPEIFVIGDLACCIQDGAPLPGVAPVAMQQGRYVAQLIQARLRGKSVPPFRYRDKGTLATIGRHHAVADFRRLRFNGFPAWVTWLFVHLLYLVGFQNRLLVLVQWAFHYFTFNRGARLITEPAGAAARRTHEVESKQ